jgi:hypothetical protein
MGKLAFAPPSIVAAAIPIGPQTVKTGSGLNSFEASQNLKSIIVPTTIKPIILAKAPNQTERSGGNGGGRRGKNLINNGQVEVLDNQSVGSNNKESSREGSNGISANQRPSLETNPRKLALKNKLAAQSTSITISSEVATSNNNS